MDAGETFQADVCNHWCLTHGGIWEISDQDRRQVDLIFRGSITGDQIYALGQLQLQLANGPYSYKLSARVEPMTRTVTGLTLIAGERRRQISDKGYTPEHDDRHDREELARAAAAYAVPTQPWPWHSDGDQRSRHAGDRLRQLAIAGALIAAEIDRLLRLKADGGGA